MVHDDTYFKILVGNEKRIVRNFLNRIFNFHQIEFRQINGLNADRFQCSIYSSLQLIKLSFQTPISVEPLLLPPGGENDGTGGATSSGITQNVTDLTKKYVCTLSKLWYIIMFSSPASNYNWTVTDFLCTCRVAPRRNLLRHQIDQFKLVFEMLIATHCSE